MERDSGPEGVRRALGRLLEAVLASRGEANAVFDILAVLQVGTRGSRRPGSRGRRPGTGPRGARGPEARVGGAEVGAPRDRPVPAVRGSRGDPGGGARVQPSFRGPAGAGRAVCGSAALRGLSHGR